MPQNVLFLCSGNSARSIMAESLLNALGGGRFQGFSAGSRPTGQVHPIALELLERNGYPTALARSKGWVEFTTPSAPRIDIVITVCDEAAREACPLFPGHPLRAHWGVADPAAAIGDDAARRQAFERAFLILRRRVQQLTSLPFDIAGPREITMHLRDIGQY